MTAIEPRIARCYLKHYFRRDLTDYQSPYDDPFEYQSILNFTMREIRRVISFVEKTTDREPLELSKTRFEELVEHAEAAYNPAHWFIAMLNGKLAGVVFPQQIPNWHEGTIYHIGLMPEFRGKGYGKIVHAKGLATLRAIGIDKYIGSTPIDNTPMVHVFLANGCTRVGLRIIEEFENGSGVALE